MEISGRWGTDWMGSSGDLPLDGTCLLLGKPDQERAALRTKAKVLKVTCVALCVRAPKLSGLFWKSTHPYLCSLDFRSSGPHRFYADHSYHVSVPLMPISPGGQELWGWVASDLLRDLPQCPG